MHWLIYVLFPLLIPFGIIRWFLHRIFASVERLPPVHGAAATATATTTTAVATVPRRIAVVGGGIAGTGCAWSIARSGHKHNLSVTLFEQRDTLGGNAKTHEWYGTNDGTGKPIRSGLSVLAWPPSLFHNYERLLRELAIATEVVRLPFAIECVDNTYNGVNGQWLHDTPNNVLSRRFSADFVRWSRMISLIRRVNNWFQGVGPDMIPTVYAMHPLNPFNIIPIRWMSRMMGCSDLFWRAIIIPVYSSSFLSTDISGAPSVMLPILSDIVPLDRIPVMHSWSGDSSLVFAAMINEGNQNHLKVLTGRGVKHLHQLKSSNIDGRNQWLVTDTNDIVHRFDQVVFAGDACSIVPMLGTNASIAQRMIFPNIQYVEGPSFRDGIIHSDSHAVLPVNSPCTSDALIGEECHNHNGVDDPIGHDAILSRYANYIRVEPCSSNSDWVYRNTFLLSSWLPAVARAKRLHNSDASSVHSSVGDGRQGDAHVVPMMVSYNQSAATRSSIIGSVGNVDNRRAHPAPGVRNMMLAQSVRWLQGRCGLWYCGSVVTPGNGHDLSLLSGLAVAYALGADFPFEDDSKCVADFRRLRALMGL